MLYLPPRVFSVPTNSIYASYGTQNTFFLTYFITYLLPEWENVYLVTLVSVQQKIPSISTESFEHPHTTSTHDFWETNRQISKVMGYKPICWVITLLKHVWRSWQHEYREAYWWKRWEILMWHPFWDSITCRFCRLWNSKKYFQEMSLSQKMSLHGSWVHCFNAC